MCFDVKFIFLLFEVSMKKIEVINRKGKKFTILVSDMDYKFVSKFSWSVKKGHSTYYAKTRISANKWGSMHRMLLKPKPHELIDHKDHNGLNNTRSNLRVCCNLLNHRNGLTHKDNSCGYKGVSFDARKNKYRARIFFEREIWLGYFLTPIDAAIAYNAAAKKYFGEFAKLNKI
jgi:hypothetical protein